MYVTIIQVNPLQCYPPSRHAYKVERHTALHLLILTTTKLRRIPCGLHNLPVEPRIPAAVLSTVQKCIQGSQAYSVGLFGLDNRIETHTFWSPQPASGAQDPPWGAPASLPPPGMPPAAPSTHTCSLAQPGRTLDSPGWGKTRPRSPSALWPPTLPLPLPCSPSPSPWRSPLVRAPRRPIRYRGTQNRPRSPTAPAPPAPPPPPPRPPSPTPRPRPTRCSLPCHPSPPSASPCLPARANFCCAPGLLPWRAHPGCALRGRMPLNAKRRGLRSPRRGRGASRGGRRSQGLSRGP